MIALGKAMQAMAPLGIRVYLLEPEISVPPVPADFPYVFLWGRPGDRLSGDDQSGSLDDEYSSLLVEVNATYVGLTPESMDSVMQRCRDAWDRKTVAVPGLAPARLKQSALQDARADKDAPLTNKRRPVFAVDQFRFIADRL